MLQKWKKFKDLQNVTNFYIKNNILYESYLNIIYKSLILFNF